MLIPQESQSEPSLTQSPSESTLICERTGASEEQNQYVRYASSISGGDIDFLATITAESQWDPYTQSTVPDPYGPNGYEDSWGFCQFHRNWFSDIVDDPRFFTDLNWQLDQCWEKYSTGSRFYGFDVRAQFLDDFTCYYQ